MTQGHMNRLLGHLRRIAEQPRSDADLLGHFIEQREEAAFAALLQRHGPMVLGLCRRILGNPHDAEDAFQATFLVLARKAASVRPREAVGNWLYGVAYRTALEARTKIARRRAREKQVSEMPQPEVKEESSWQELLPLLDREVHRLPDKYRLAVVLCDLEGRSRKEVARQLAIPEGTLSSRLTTAHKKLAMRLARFGFAVSGASLAALLAGNTLSATVPASLLAATTKAALLIVAGKVAGVSATVITLTEGVLRTMFLAKIKTATVLVVALFLGTGGLCYLTRAGAADTPQVSRKPTADEEKARERALLEALDKARKEAVMERDRAVAEPQRAEEALRQLKEQLAKAQDAEKRARQQAERALYAENVRQAQQEFEKGASPKQEAAMRLKRLDEMEARLRERLKEERQTLAKRMQQLEAEERESLAKLEAERGELLRQQSAGRPTRPTSGQQPPDGDKLDRILERLDRIERRLDKLERGGRK